MKSTQADWAYRDCSLIMSWYDSVRLDRVFTAHEKQVFANTGVMLRTETAATTISADMVRRPMNLPCTHYHHMNALLAFISYQTDLDIESLIHYDKRELRTDESTGLRRGLKH